MTSSDWVFCGLMCAFWFVFWALWFHYKLEKYVEKRCRIPMHPQSSYGTDRDAKLIRSFILDRARNIMKDASSSPHYNLRDRMAYRTLDEWDGWNYLRSFVWLCYEFGIGAEFFTYNTNERLYKKGEELKDWEEKALKNYPELFDHFKFESPGMGFVPQIITLLLLSGGALMSIIAFVLVLVMC